MLLLRAFPATKDIPANREFRRFFYSKWGNENCVISAHERYGEYPMFTQRLSIKAAWGGSELYILDGRTISVDDDTYLVINDGRTYASTLDSEKTVHSFSIFFRPGFAEEALGALQLPTDRLLDAGSESLTRPVEFAEHLLPHDRLVTPLLRYIAGQVDAGLEDEMWYEQQFGFLLERMLRAHRMAQTAIDSLGLSRRSTRREIIRRIGWSMDYINTYFMRSLAIGDLAKAASLSQFHYIRLFRAVHGVTPFAYLQRKRAAVALRLLLSTDLDQDEVAALVGFRSQSTMYRHLRRLTGSGPRNLRRDSHH